MRVWAIANQKGGVGKTTTTLALGRLLAERGRRVLLIDLDPHASLTRTFDVPVDPPPRGCMELFDTPPMDPRALARDTAVPTLSLLAAQPAMATLERRSAAQPGLGLAIGQALVRAGNDYDYALLDCPPTLGLLMVNALAAADRIVVPTQTEPLALHGLAGMLRTVGMIERSRRRALPVSVIPTQFDRRTRVGVRTLDELQERYGDVVWHRAIPVDTRLRDAATLCAAELPPRSASRGLDEYHRALDWLLREDQAAQMQPATERAA